MSRRGADIQQRAGHGLLGIVVLALIVVVAVWVATSKQTPPWSWTCAQDTRTAEAPCLDYHTKDGYLRDVPTVAPPSPIGATS